MPDFSDKAIHDWLPLYNTLLPFYTGMDVLIEEVRNHLAYEDAEKSTPKNISGLLAGDIPFIRAKDVLLNTASYPGSPEMPQPVFYMSQAYPGCSITGDYTDKNIFSKHHHICHLNFNNERTNF